MDYHLDTVHDTLVYLVTLHIDASIDAVWHLIATTEGYETWFPEIEIHHDEDEVYFITPELEEVLQLIEYKPDTIISYTWDSATVSFTLSSTDQGVTVLFEENIPQDFPHISRDMAGWFMQLSRLKACAEEKTFDFDHDAFKVHMQRFDDHISTLLSSQ